MIKLLRKILKKAGDKNTTAIQAERSFALYGMDNLEDDVIGYPPSPKGIPVVQPSVLIDRMNQEIRFIQNELGLKPEEFDKYMKPVMLRFIEFADLLPASEYKHHATGGGLIYHSFDVAKRAMRSAQCTQFPVGIGTMADTQQSNKQWKAATVLAALLHDGGKILADVVISNGMNDDNRVVWDAHGPLSIHDWAAKHNIERYYVSWRKQRHEKHQNASLMVMQRLIPDTTWSWIDSCFDGKDIHSAMLSALTKASVDHPMSMIVTKCDGDSAREDMFNRNSHITKEVKRVPLSELLCDLMRHYILTNQWQVNKNGAPVWFVNDKLYVIWSSAVPTLLEAMMDAGYKIPEVPEVLARLMIEEGMATANGEKPYHAIYPEILGDPKKPSQIQGLLIRNPSRIILDLDKLYSIKEHPKPKEKSVTNNEGKAATSASTEVEKIVPEEHELPQSSPIKKSFSATALGALSRVLDMMVAKKTEQPESNHTHSEAKQGATDDEVFDQIENDLGGYVAEYAHDQSEYEPMFYGDAYEVDTSEHSDFSDYEAYANLPIENQTTPMSQREQEPIEKEIVMSVAQQKALKCPLAIHLTQAFSYPINNGSLIIPKTDYEKVRVSLLSANIGGLNEFTVGTMLGKTKEVTFDE